LFGNEQSVRQKVCVVKKKLRTVRHYLTRKKVVEITATDLIL
jgi:hypothetical protein